MKQILKLANQQILGYTEKVNFIKKQANGVYGLCSEEQAQGIAYDGKTYKLYNKGENIEGDVVVVTDIDFSKIYEKINVTNSIAFVTLAEESKIDEATSSEHLELFEDFKENIEYKVGQIRKYKGKLYKCIEAHTSQSDWTPDTAVSLWKQIGDPTEEYPTWSQPVGAHDSYQKGDRVTYENKKYVSSVDNNVWQPGVYGWTEVVESEG